MADFLSPEDRSVRMSRIRGVDTVPELIVRRHLHSVGFRYRLHDRSLPGRPDLVLPRHKVVIFVNGCFWHAHRCQKGRIPASRSKFWEAKFAANQARDARNARRLRRVGWRVLTVWECTLGNTSKRSRTLDNLVIRILAKTPSGS
jgi:DNA mismatch endonuclease (patch repair protein)